MSSARRLPGAIAQAQRLQTETKDGGARQRAADIEASLKRLTRMAERLLQLARAEGGPLRLDRSMDLRKIADIVLADLERISGPNRIVTYFPQHPVLSYLDPDAFGIICRNLVENALRYGSPTEPIEVTLKEDGTFSVANEGPVVEAASLAHLTERFRRDGQRQRRYGPRPRDRVSDRGTDFIAPHPAVAPVRLFLGL